MTRPQRTPIDWPAYIATFHAQRPGITQAVLTRCRAGGHNPYEWLLQDIDRNASILDLACGNAPTRPRRAIRWVGIDRSHAELDAARLDNDSHLVLADANQLPLADATFDTVVCAMALMLITPLDDALDEIRRVLKPGGTLHLLLPAASPLTLCDRVRFTNLFLVLRTQPQFPAHPLNRDPQRVLGDGVWTVTGNERRRYSYPVNTREDADRFIDSLYLPNVSPRRLQRAHTYAGRWRGHDIGIPLRHITATIARPSEQKT